MRILSRLAAAIVLAALASAAGGAPQDLRIGTRWTGSTYGVDSFVIPPDTDGAVGIRHVVELINGHYAVYRKNNGQRVASLSMDAFWSAGGVTPRGFVVDPRVVFDPFAGRWYASAFSINSGNGADDLLLAVSVAQDPTQGWKAFAVPFAGPVGNFADFPTLGFNHDAVFIYTNGGVLVAPKADLLAPGASVARATMLASTSLLSPSGSKAQPVVDLDDSADALILGTWDVDGSVLRQWRLTGGPLAPALQASEDFVNLTPYGSMGNQGALQPQSGIGISTSSPLLASSVVLRDGILWGVQTVALQGRAALRWFAIDAATHAPLQEGLITDGTHDFFMGSLAVNACQDVVIGFNRSGTDQFASAYAVAGHTEGGVTTFGEPVLLRQGLARYDETGGAPVARWGDYSATVADPQHTRTFWTFQQWPSAVNVWATEVVELRVGGGGKCAGPGR
jgi:hypothetical protein